MNSLAIKRLTPQLVEINGSQRLAVRFQKTSVDMKVWKRSSNRIQCTGSKNEPHTQKKKESPTPVPFANEEAEPQTQAVAKETVGNRGLIEKIMEEAGIVDVNTAISPIQAEIVSKRLQQLLEKNNVRQSKEDDTGKVIMALTEEQWLAIADLLDNFNTLLTVLTGLGKKVNLFLKENGGDAVDGETLADLKSRYPVDTEVDVGGKYKGKIVEVGSYSTKCVDEKGQFFGIPNSEFQTQAVWINDNPWVPMEELIWFTFPEDIEDPVAVLQTMDLEIIAMMNEIGKDFIDFETVKPSTILGRSGVVFEITLKCNLKKDVSNKLDDHKRTLLFEASKIVGKYGTKTFYRS